MFKKFIFGETKPSTAKGVVISGKRKNCKKTGAHIS